MSEIKINPEKLDRAAEKMHRVLENMLEQRAGMDRICLDVESAWKSDVTGLYIENMEQVKHNMDRLIRETEQIIEALKRTAAQVREAEKQNKEAFIRSSGGER